MTSPSRGSDTWSTASSTFPINHGLADNVMQHRRLTPGFAAVLQVVSPRYIKILIVSTSNMGIRSGLRFCPVPSQVPGSLPAAAAGFPANLSAQ